MPPPPLPRCPPRERQVLAQYAAGNRTREVADNLGLSERTVLAHAAGATRKLGAKTRLHAIALAVHRRIVDVGG